MTPDTAQEQLYNDIVPLSAVQEEHDELRAVLAAVCECIEIEDVLTDIAAEPDGPATLLGALLGNDPTAIQETTALWDDLTPGEIARNCATGIARRPHRLSHLGTQARYLSPPLPNLYFSRDIGFVVSDTVYRSAMAHAVRKAESELLELVARRLGYAVESGIAAADIHGGSHRTVEGGDVLVLGPDHLMIGLGERSNAAGVDRFLELVAANRDTELTAIVVELPERRATIHLDMIATIVDYDLLLGYHPLLRGPGACPVHVVSIPPGTQRWSIHHFSELEHAMDHAGLPYRIMPWVDQSPIRQEREQWFSACNSVALSPGRIVVYRNNPASLDALSMAGFEIIDGSAVARDPEALLACGGRVAIAVRGVELARGGGGPRCMTLPLERRALEA